MVPFAGGSSGRIRMDARLDLDGQWKTVPAAKTSEGALQLQLPLAAHQVVVFRWIAL